MGRGTWWRVGVAALVALMIGVVVVSLAGRRACSKVGCTSAVGFDVSSLPPEVRAAAVSVTLCANDTCTTGALDEIIGATIDGPTVRSASLDVTGVAGTVVAHLDLAGPVGAHLAQPNGPDCEPTCWQLQLVADGASLVPAA